MLIVDSFTKSPFLYQIHKKPYNLLVLLIAHSPCHKIILSDENQRIQHFAICDACQSPYKNFEHTMRHSCLYSLKIRFFSQKDHQVLIHNEKDFLRDGKKVEISAQLDFKVDRLNGERLECFEEIVFDRAIWHWFSDWSNL